MKKIPPFWRRFKLHMTAQDIMLNRKAVYKVTEQDENGNPLKEYQFIGRVPKNA